MRACVAALFLIGAAGAQAQDVSGQPGIQALAAPLAGYSEPLRLRIALAATYPGEVTEAARLGPTARGRIWSPAVEALLDSPEILQWMAANPQWMLDLGTAYFARQAQLMTALRQPRQGAVQPPAFIPPLASAYYDQAPVLAYAAPVLLYAYVPVAVPVYRVVAARPAYAAQVFVSNDFRERHLPNGPPSPAAQLQQANTARYVQAHGNAPPRGNALTQRPQHHRPGRS